MRKKLGMQVLPATISAALIALLPAAGCTPERKKPATMSVSGGPVLTSGTAVTVTYAGGYANDFVVVDIDDGDVDYKTRKTDSVRIELDANGGGKAEWTVPAWDFVNFNAPRVHEISRTVTP